MVDFKFGNFPYNHQFAKLRTLPNFPAIRYLTATYMYVQYSIINSVAYVYISIRTVEHIKLRMYTIIHSFSCVYNIIHSTTIHIIIRTFSNTLSYVYSTIHQLHACVISSSGRHQLH